MKYFTKFDDETLEQARGESTLYDSVEDLVDSMAGAIGEDEPFEIYDTNGKFHSRYVWNGGTPMKSNLPRGINK